MSSDVKQGNSLQCSADLPHILFYNNEEDIDKLIVNLKKILNNSIDLLVQIISSFTSLHYIAFPVVK